MEHGGARPWVVLVAGVVAVGSGCAVQYGLPYLVPGLLAEGLSLPAASLLVACPVLGLLLTLLAWGAAADRWGERIVLICGLSVGAGALVVGSQAGGVPTLAGCLVVAGMGTAAVHAASGRLVLGWFPAHRRGVAMAIRQTAQPLGVAAAALLLPGHSGLVRPLLTLAGLCVGAVLLTVLLIGDPPRPPKPDVGEDGSPYRTAMLWRVHAASALLVVPQFTVATFALVYLVDEQAWTAVDAGRLLAAAQIGGAAARLLAGAWSDRVGSRLRPMRVLAVATAACGAVLSLVAATGLGLVVAVVVLAAALTVSTNGLAFTAVAERAGAFWAGRALGVHNTTQNALAAATPPVIGLVVGLCGYPVAFAAVAVFPMAAAVLIPTRDEDRAQSVAGGGGPTTTSGRNS